MMKFPILCLILIQLTGKLEADQMFKSIAKLYKIRRDVNVSIITSFHHISTLSQCSLVCMKNMSSSFYFNGQGKQCYCNSDLDNSTDYETTKTEITYGVFESVIHISKMNENTKWTIKPYRRDCLALYNDGYTNDGVYTIKPPGGTQVDTWCDMTGGGWTVFQRRMNGEEDFNRTWVDFRSGFGDRTGEYWLGLEPLYLLTREPSELTIEMETWGDTSPASDVALYSTFSISGESDKYRLTVGSFSSLSGGCGDHLNSNNRGFTSYNMPFTTKDRDNDNKDAYNCAVNYPGGWWFNGCFRAQLNGIYRKAGESFPPAKGVVSVNCWGYNNSLKKTVMKLKRT